MSGRSIRKKEVSGTALTLMGQAQKEYDALYQEIIAWWDRSPIGSKKKEECHYCLLQMRSIPWPPLPKLEDVIEWPVVKAEVTDYQPRKGKKLQRWKRAEMIGELVGVAALSMVKLEESLDKILEEINADEEASLDEIAAKGAWYEELGNKIWAQLPEMERLSNELEGIQFPALR